VTTTYDYLIIGSGIAGLYAAILAREHGSVLVLTKGSIDDCNTRWAQGGIAASVGPGDSPEKHLRDTIAAGAGLVDEEAARVLTAEASDRIADLVSLGVPFDTVHGEIALATEGAHSTPRILHAGGDSTGAHIELTLASVARLEGITVLEYTIAMEIVTEIDGNAPRKGGSRIRRIRRTAPTTSDAAPMLRATSVLALNTASGERTAYACRNLILAAGGAGQMYQTTTNPEVATGDGIAIAYRAGAEIMDMEFIQFHPTALHLPGVQPFLISEAVRGEGGLLRDVNGERFMADYDDRAELAPRDIVSRAIRDRMLATDSDHVLLDVTHLDAGLVTARFPQIYRFCFDNGLDITRQPIPIAPAAHYTMGGVRTNTWGETNVAGLYAAGECACTGVHGANRLASNSLLETVVFAFRVIQRTIEAPGGRAEPATDTRSLRTVPGDAPGAGDVPRLSREALQSLMWRDAGIVRDGASLARAASVLAAWQSALATPTDRPSQELADLLTCCRLVTEAALAREESRGAHYRDDFPEPREAWRRHLVYQRDGGAA
jgi:L-aspartate oxidase